MLPVTAAGVHWPFDLTKHSEHNSRRENRTQTIQFLIRSLDRSIAFRRVFLLLSIRSTIARKMFKFNVVLFLMLCRHGHMNSCSQPISTNYYWHFFSSSRQVGGVKDFYRSFSSLFSVGNAFQQRGKICVNTDVKHVMLWLGVLPQDADCRLILYYKEHHNIYVKKPFFLYLGASSAAVSLVLFYLVVLVRLIWDWFVCVRV